MEQIDSGLVSAFLEYLEAKRRNAAVTRNVRLAAIKSFFRFLQYRQPAALDQVRRVRAIPFKKTDTRLVPYLLREELQALLDAPNPTTRDGNRSHARPVPAADGARPRSSHRYVMGYGSRPLALCLGISPTRSQSVTRPKLCGDTVVLASARQVGFNSPSNVGRYSATVG